MAAIYDRWFLDTSEQSHDRHRSVFTCMDEHIKDTVKFGYESLMDIKGSWFCLDGVQLCKNRDHKVLTEVLGVKRYVVHLPKNFFDISKNKKHILYYKSWKIPHTLLFAMARCALFFLFWQDAPFFFDFGKMRPCAQYGHIIVKYSMDITMKMAI